MVFDVIKNYFLTLCTDLPLFQFVFPSTLLIFITLLIEYTNCLPPSIYPDTVSNCARFLINKCRNVSSLMHCNSLNNRNDNQQFMNLLYSSHGLLLHKYCPAATCVSYFYFYSKKKPLTEKCSPNVSIPKVFFFLTCNNEKTK